MIHKTVLVIDDEQPIVQIVHAILSTDDYTVMSANSGARGFEMAKKFRPDLIILDRYMPDHDGLKVLQHLKKDPHTKDIPVMMLTGENKIEEVKKSISIGASGYIIKPFKSGDFKNKIKKILDPKRDLVTS